MLAAIGKYGVDGVFKFFPFFIPSVVVIRMARNSVGVICGNGLNILVSGLG